MPKGSGRQGSRRASNQQQPSPPPSRATSRPTSPAAARPRNYVERPRSPIEQPPSHDTDVMSQSSARRGKTRRDRKQQPSPFSEDLLQPLSASVCSAPRTPTPPLPTQQSQPSTLLYSIYTSKVSELQARDQRMTSQRSQQQPPPSSSGYPPPTQPPTQPHQHPHREHSHRVREYERECEHDATPAPRAASVMEFAEPHAYAAPPQQEGRAHRTAEWARDTSQRSHTSYTYTRSRENLSQASWDAASVASAGSYAYSYSNVTSKKQSPPQQQQPRITENHPTPTPPPHQPAPEHEPALGVRRRRSPGDDADDAAKRVCAEASGDDTDEASLDTLASATERSFANVAASAAAPQQTPQPSTSGYQPPPPLAAEPKTPRMPPLVVERLPDWPRHLEEIKKRLGRVANARPFGRGIRFSPKDADEFRVVQKYLTELEHTEKISWFSYEMPSERNLKVAIRGLPLETPIDALTEALVDRGFEPVFIRTIRARGDRPGCLLFAELKRTSNIFSIYNVTELLNVPGIIIEGWRGKRRPAQCHRCQQFRHSSMHCHRPLACVRCGDAHAARDCPRPRETPATCANCGGAHPANYTGCPTMRREARHRQAGTVASVTRLKGGPSAKQHEKQVAADAASATLMARANPATQRDAPPQSSRKKHRRGKKKKKPTTATAHAPPTQPRVIATAADPDTKTSAAPSALNKDIININKNNASTPAMGNTLITRFLAILQSLLVAIVADNPREEQIKIIIDGIAVLSPSVVEEEASLVVR